MRLHDYCSGAGLAADGYATIFGANTIHGYDINPQPHYPYTHTTADVRVMLTNGLPPATARHFSFPCQTHTTAGHLRDAQGGTSRYDDLLTPGLEVVRRRYNDTPWIMENVDDRAGHVRRIMTPHPGESLIVLCGTMFGLPIWRHRLFLANFPLRQPEPIPGPGKYRRQGCRHDLCDPDPITGRPRPWGIYHVPGDTIPAGGRTCIDADHAAQVMGVTRTLPWDSLKEGFPPAYTTHVAADLLVELTRRGNYDNILTEQEHAHAR